ncbi:hypothetical protein L486_03157 [Kwoniella mangroviensis CBS 10435]|uniref:Uncharacterized protein n=1 Tax=Kwoniella mangroviensis CBS 10435 TaxID=1331196 RepID=A0A1B9IT18_9TREE|nr:hypothetical protein L486_03157 [Kwoniella mangroviensis CBS 10435]
MSLVHWDPFTSKLLHGTVQQGEKAVDLMLVGVTDVRVSGFRDFGRCLDYVFKEFSKCGRITYFQPMRGATRDRDLTMVYLGFDDVNAVRKAWSLHNKRYTTDIVDRRSPQVDIWRIQSRMYGSWKTGLPSEFAAATPFKNEAFTNASRRFNRLGPFQIDTTITPIPLAQLHSGVSFFDNIDRQILRLITSDSTSNHPAGVTDAVITPSSSMSARPSESRLSPIHNTTVSVPTRATSYQGSDSGWGSRAEERATAHAVEEDDGGWGSRAGEDVTQMNGGEVKRVLVEQEDDGWGYNPQSNGNAGSITPTPAVHLTAHLDHQDTPSEPPSHHSDIGGDVPEISDHIDINHYYHHGYYQFDESSESEAVAMDYYARLSSRLRFARINPLENDVHIDIDRSSADFFGSVNRTGHFYEPHCIRSRPTGYNLVLLSTPLSAFSSLGFDDEAVQHTDMCLMQTTVDEEEALNLRKLINAERGKVGLQKKKKDGKKGGKLKTYPSLGVGFHPPPDSDEEQVEGTATVTGWLDEGGDELEVDVDVAGDEMDDSGEGEDNFAGDDDRKEVEDEQDEYQFETLLIHRDL